jgi:hypothetical protein
MGVLGGGRSFRGWGGGTVGRMDRWEYRVEPVSTSHVDWLSHCLNQLGSEGWELVTVDWGGLGRVQHPLAIFKRRATAWVPARGPGPSAPPAPGGR